VTAAIAALCGVFGLVIGSFLNVVIWRVPRDESIVRPPSHCPSCGHEIRNRDNIPVVSWLLLRGKCRDCGASISVRYPLVELLTGGLFVVMALKFGLDWQLPAYIYLAAVGVALALIDLDVKRLPNALTYPSYVVGAALLGVAAATGHGSSPYIRALLGMVALFGFYFVLVLVYPSGMGFGDVKLAGVLGLYLGWLGWGSLIVGAFAGFLLGALVGIGLMLFKGEGRKAKIPFGPFMLTGAFIAILVGQPLADAYNRVTLGG
jgi:leader peptidase (prepilin peptidase)/N-methyltransferase